LRWFGSTNFSVINRMEHLNWGYPTLFTDIWISRAFGNWKHPPPISPFVADSVQLYQRTERTITVPGNTQINTHCGWTMPSAMEGSGRERPTSGGPSTWGTGRWANKPSP
jgi:hypothetical protein